jgi:hypothetical protein
LVAPVAPSMLRVCAHEDTTLYASFWFLRKNSCQIVCRYLALKNVPAEAFQRLM